MPLKRPKNAPRLWLPLLLVEIYPLPVERLKVSLKTHGRTKFGAEMFTFFGG
jgi:hypothetical protein